MGRREQFTVGELTFAGIPRTMTLIDVVVLAKDHSENVLICSGKTKPTDASTGFAKGCLFIKTDAGAGVSGLYENTGTNTSCVFSLMGGNLAGSVTNAMLAGSITYDKLTAGAGIAALLGAGLGGSFAITKTTAPADNTVVAAHPTKDRAVLVVAIVTEAFATGTGTRTLITVGETATLNKMWANTIFPNGLAINTVLVGAFTNTSTKAITVSNVAAVGDGTGGVTIIALAIPTT